VKKNKRRIIITLILVVIIPSIAFLVANEIGKSSLEKELLRGWTNIEYGDKTYIKNILDFDGSRIEYRVELAMSFLNSTIMHYDYKVVCWNKIKTNEYRVHSITFNSDKTIMTVTPAITSVEDSEVWHNAD
jgi:hypothetical protein